MWEKFKAWLGIAQHKASDAFQHGEDAIKAAGRKVDEAAHKASAAIQNSDPAKKLDELGRKIGGTKGPGPR